MICFSDSFVYLPYLQQIHMQSPPPRQFKLISIKPHSVKPTEFLNCTVDCEFRKSKFHRPFLKPPLLMILTSSLQWCYHKGTWAKPGNHITKWYSFWAQSSAHRFSHDFHFSPTILIFCFTPFSSGFKELNHLFRPGVGCLLQKYVVFVWIRDR